MKVRLHIDRKLCNYITGVRRALRCASVNYGSVKGSQNVNLVDNVTLGISKVFRFLCEFCAIILYCLIDSEV